MSCIFNKSLCRHHAVADLNLQVMFSVTWISSTSDKEDQFYQLLLS